MKSATSWRKWLMRHANNSEAVVFHYRLGLRRLMAEMLAMYSYFDYCDFARRSWSVHASPCGVPRRREKLLLSLSMRIPMRRFSVLD